MRYAFSLVLLAVALGGAYLLGCSHAEIKIITKEKEVIRYVDRKQAEIQSRPHAGRTELLKLMHNGQL